MVIKSSRFRYDVLIRQSDCKDTIKKTVEHLEKK